MQDIELQPQAAPSITSQTTKGTNSRPSVRPILAGGECFDRCGCQCCESEFCKQARWSILGVLLLGTLALSLILIGVLLLVFEEWFAGIFLLIAGILFVVSASYPCFKVVKLWQENQGFEVLDEDAESTASPEERDV